MFQKIAFSLMAFFGWYLCIYFCTINKMHHNYLESEGRCIKIDGKCSDMSVWLYNTTQISLKHHLSLCLLRNADDLLLQLFFL